MTAKISLILLTVLLLQTIVPAEVARPQNQTADLMKQILSQAQSKHKPVKVVLIRTTDGRKKIIGTVTAVSDAGFTLIENKTGETREFAYADVQHVSHKGMSTGLQIVLGLGVAVAVVVAIFYAIYPKT